MQLSAYQFLKPVFLAVLSLFLIQCSVAPTAKPAAPLATDILRLRVGEDKNAAETRLKEIAKLIRIEEKRQEVWALKDDPHFSHLAVGYDGENRLRYVTAYTKMSGGTPIKADEIGDLAKARLETVGPNYTYVWQTADGDQDAYKVTVRGNQPDKFAFYTLSSLAAQNSEEEEEKAEQEASEEKSERAKSEQKPEKREGKEKAEKDRDAKEK